MSDRRGVIPNANSPALLARLLEMVAQGVRTTRGLQEVLGVDVRTVQYYCRAGEWLGLLEPDPVPTLSSLGLRFVYDVEGRTDAYARAVWSNPLVRDLLEGPEATLPDADDIAEVIARAEPDLAPATARRRASSVRSLLAPAVGHTPGSGTEPEQLDLPLPLRDTAVPPPKLRLGADAEYDPDVYRYLFAALLDHGELGLGHVRALLDRADVERAPIGGYVDLAVQRGDVHRMGERLVISREAVARRDVVETTASVILSDLGYRQYLDDVRTAASGDRAAEIRRDNAARRYKTWDVRLLGRRAQPDTLDADLSKVLMDRSLGSFPSARGGSDPPPVHEASFLDSWERSDLIVCLPPSLAQIQGGVAAVNRRLTASRRAPDVGLPDLVTRPSVVHGALLHPGEPMPRSVPDTRSLRLRTLLNAPYAALVTAVVLGHRRGGARLHQLRGSWVILRGSRRVGPLLDLLDAFGRARGWLVARRRNGLDARTLLAALEAVGVVSLVGDNAILAERFFAQLRSEAEENEIHERLRPLADALESWLDQVPVEGHAPS